MPSNLSSYFYSQGELLPQVVLKMSAVGPPVNPAYPVNPVYPRLRGSCRWFPKANPTKDLTTDIPSTLRFHSCMVFPRHAAILRQMCILRPLSLSRTLPLRRMLSLRMCIPPPLSLPRTLPLRHMLSLRRMPPRCRLARPTTIPMDTRKALLTSDPGMYSPTSRRRMATPATPTSRALRYDHLPIMSARI